MNWVLNFFNSLEIKFHAHIIDSLFAIAIIFVFFIILNVGTKPFSPDIAASV